MPSTSSLTPEDFIKRWQGVTASELATAQTFVIDLCELLQVPKPHATADRGYMFERPVTFVHGNGSTSAGRLDCYRRGHFVLEAKKLKAGAHTKGFDDGLLRARSQGESYARALPAEEGRPPFVLVVDVGNVIEIYAEFSRSGATYTPFPDPRSHRLALADLAKPEIQDRLRRIWTDPESLNPSRISAKVTREVSDRLAKLARSLEESGHASKDVAAYLTRCLFSMFAEDVGLLPASAFLKLLKDNRSDPAALRQMLRVLWADMDKGGFSAALVKHVLRFNGKLFKGAEDDTYSLLLTTAQIDLLVQASQSNWREVEPAIFGTLLERALDPDERHALGAHYTPRAYVERLVLPSVMEPLREEWRTAQAAALLIANEAAELEANAPAVTTKKDFRALDRHNALVRTKWSEARQQVRNFHHRLCTVRVLDPACGSANFLYVTLEHLKRLEGEVLNQLKALGEAQESLGLAGETVTLQQLLGIETNPRAAALAELVLWIGFLQWHIRTFGDASVAEPVVHDYKNIENRDAVLDFDAREIVLNASGAPLTRWDGVTTKAHPVTGLQVPDETATMPVYVYKNPSPAPWPEAEFIVGNPPYIGAGPMRAALGEGYVEALRGCWPHVPESADFVMYWWQRAASLVSSGKALRFGLITTNSIKQTFNRRVVQTEMDAGLNLAFAIPDHPWVDASDGAAVRVAMTVGEALSDGLAGAGVGRLVTVTHEGDSTDGEVEVTLLESRGILHADLRVGANVAAAKPLMASTGISAPGVKLHGKGFKVTREEARALGLGAVPGLDRHIRDYLGGRDLTAKSKDGMVIDMFGLDENEVRGRFPAVYQWLLERVKPDRMAKADTKDGAGYAKQWWVHGKPRPQMRHQLAGLRRYIATTETAKHRIFQFLDSKVLPDNMIIAIASDDPVVLGILSSSVHVNWALAAGGRLGVGNDPRYNKGVCFETFPFPTVGDGMTFDVAKKISELALQLDHFRKDRLALHPNLTLTKVYNVLVKVREGGELSAAEKNVNEQGLVSVLKSLHQDLDAAVLKAYGWSDLDISVDAEVVLQRLVDLNTRRAAAEASGEIYWVRPEYQSRVDQAELIADAQLDGGEDIDESDEELGEGAVVATPAIAAKRDVRPWPAGIPEQIKAVSISLVDAGSAVDIEWIAAGFNSRGRWKERLATILDTLVAIGRARVDESGRWIDAGR